MPCARHVRRGSIFSFPSLILACCPQRAICATTHSQTVIRPPRRYHHLPMLTCIQPPRALGLTDHSSSGDQVRQIEDSCQAGVDGVLSCQNNPSPALQSLLTNVSLSDLTIANRVESPHPTPCISATSFQGHSGSLLAYDNQFHTPSPMRVFSTSGHEYFDYQGPCDTYSRIYSERFPENHYLDPAFTELYLLGDELGSGGYGFVMTALHRELGLEVAVKFIVKNKVPEKAWVEDNIFGKIPAEIMILRMIDHENIVKCLDVFEDELYFYAVCLLHSWCWMTAHLFQVQELHGFPWQRAEGPPRGYSSSPESSSIPCYPLPSLLSPTASDCSNTDSEPETPPQPYNLISAVHPSSTESVPCYPLHYNRLFSHKEDNASVFLPCSTRRPSHDLFEYIEQTKHKRLSEAQARYIMAQVVEAVYYLDSHGIAHRDIKDENLLIDRELKVGHPVFW